MPSIEWYLDRHGDTLETHITYYQTYLGHTDYIAAKLAEAVYTGEKMADDYSEVIDRRKEARRKINELTEELSQNGTDEECTERGT
mgnify:FL=1